MRWLLIGGAGLLGTNLAPALQLAGHDVFIVDNFSGSFEYRTPKTYPIFSSDSTNYNSLLYTFNKVNPEVVVVMVGYYYDSVKGRYSSYEEGGLILNTANVLASLLKSTTKHVYFCSHSDVYGGPDTSRLSENRKITLSTTYRGAAFLSAESILLFRATELGVPVTILRLFDMVGPRIQFTPVSCRLNFLIDAFLRREQIGLSGATKKRDFIHVSDVVSAIVGLYEQGFEGTINIGTGIGITLRAACKELGKSLKIYIPPVELDDRSMPSYSSVADISKLREAVPWWEPKVDVLDYLSDLVEFRRKEQVYYSPENLPNVLSDQRRKTK